MSSTAAEGRRPTAVDVVNEAAGRMGLVVSPALVVPLAPAAELVAATRAYRDTCEAMLDASDYQTIIQDGREQTFRKRSGWRKLGVAYGINAEVTDERFRHDDDGHITRAYYRVTATAPNGRHMDGIGVCDISERRFGRKQDHDIPSTAHTRAINRAFADLFGLGEVSAEEVTSDPGGPPAKTERTTGKKSSTPAVHASAVAVAAELITTRLGELTPAEQDQYRTEVIARNLPWPPTRGAHVTAHSAILDELDKAREPAG